MQNKDENMNLIRYILMLPISILAAELLMFIRKYSDFGERDLVIFAAMFAFLGTFEFVMPKKNIFLRILNIILCLGCFFDDYSHGNREEMILFPVVLYMLITYIGKIISYTGKIISYIFKRSNTNEISLNDVNSKKIKCPSCDVNSKKIKCPSCNEQLVPEGDHYMCLYCFKRFSKEELKN